MIRQNTYFGMWTNTAIMAILPSHYKSTGPSFPTAQFTTIFAPATGATWDDHDAVNASFIFIAGSDGINAGVYEPSSSTWRRVKYSGGPADLRQRLVAVSTDRQMLYTSNFTHVWAMDIATGVWALGGAPVAVAPAGTQYR